MSAIEDLFAEVYANPNDDQLKRVLADALMAANDPRGELILFQLEPDKDHHRRAMRLIQAHGLSWLGPLRGAVIPLAYERGFLASCALLETGTDALEHEIWATVHTIDLDDFDDVNIGKVRITPVMRSLKRLIGLSPTQELILRKHQPVDRLELVLNPRYQDLEPYDPVDE